MAQGKKYHVLRMVLILNLLKTNQRLKIIKSTENMDYKELCMDLETFCIQINLSLSSIFCGLAKAPFRVYLYRHMHTCLCV